MISKNFNPVARQQIWTEHLLKENRFSKVKATFQANPRTMRSHLITDKVQRSNPVLTRQRIAEVAPRNSRQNTTKISAKTAPKVIPRENNRPGSVSEKHAVYRAMMSRLGDRGKKGRTTNGKYGGWDMNDADAQLLTTLGSYNPKNSCDITQYANEYVLSQGFNPFCDPSKSKLDPSEPPPEAHAHRPLWK